MKTSHIPLFAGLLIFFTNTIFAQAPSGYYNSLEGKSGSELKKAVKTIAKKGHKTIEYGTDTWNAFHSTDVRTINGQSYWWDMYSDNNVLVSSETPSSMNVEHSVPNSWWGKNKNDAYKDIVHLNPSDKDANSRKGNYPLGEISGSPTWNNGVTFIGHPKSGQGGGCTMVFEPHDMYKGDFARVFMYMFTVYDDITWKEASSTNTDGKGRMYNYSGGTAQFQTWATELLLAWSKADPVSDKEIYRNNGIQKEQGNRNPFIDLPELAEYIWGSKKNETFHLDGIQQPEPTDPEEPENPDIEEPQPGEDDPIIFDPETAGKYLRAETNNDIFVGGKYIIVASESGVAMSTVTGKDQLKPTSAVTIEGNTIAELPEKTTAIVTLEEAGESKYYMAISDSEGNKLGYVSSSGAKKIALVNTPEEGQTLTSINVNGGIATITIGGTFLKYNASATMFRPYASGQEDVAMYRFIPEEIPSAIEEVPSQPEIFVIGNSIYAPEGSMIFDLNGRRLTGKDMEKGIYIVVSPAKEKTVKVIID